MIRKIARTIKRAFGKILEQSVFMLLAPMICAISRINRPKRNSRLERILLIPEFDSFGGTRTYFRMLLEFFDSQGWETYIGLRRNQIDDDIERLCETRNATILPIFELPHWITARRRAQYVNLVYDVFSVANLVRTSRPDCLVISVGSPGDYAGLLLLPYRILYILHTSPTIELDRFLSVAVNAGLSRGKELLTVSEYSRGSICRHWIRDRRKLEYVRFIHNAASAPVQSIFTDNRSVKTILTMGHLVDYKNPQQWLRVAKEVIHRSPKGSVHFVWLGAGPLYKECVESLDEEQKRYIHFLGHCADPRRNLAEASVYFQPSLLESHGLAVVEAMSNGVPCVVSRAGGLPESVSDGYDGFLVDLGDDSVIAEKILCLLNDEKLRREMGGRARQTSLKKFSMDVWRSKMKVEFEGLR